MKSDYRSGIKKQLRDVEQAGLELVSLNAEQVAAHAHEIHELYLQVHEKQKLRLVTLRPDWIPALAKRFGSGFRTTVIRRREGDPLLGFVTFNDEFVSGLVDIFNEAPVRQGFRFWHYGKSFETVKREFSRFLFREDLIGAYYQNELIGFAMVANAGRYGMIGMFLAKMKHRDKATNNALIAKAVEICEKRKLPFLIYTTWRQTSLVDFKRHSGFQEMMVPRYFVPLSKKGKLALFLGWPRFYHGFGDGLPEVIKGPLKKLRKHYYNFRWGSTKLST
jgi:hypothetical protein